MLTYGLRNAALTAFGRLQAATYDPSKTLTISGSPRSGTTWLGEVLASLPGACLLWEPLHLQRQKDLAKRGFSWRTLPSGLEDPEPVYATLRDILRGRRLNAGMVHPGTPLRTVAKRRFWVIKFVRANALLPWIGSQPEFRAPLLLVRHPCAYSAQQN